MSDATKVLVRLELPGDLVDAYERQAASAGLPLDDVIAGALEYGRNWSDVAYVIDRDSDRAIRNMLGAMVGSGKLLVERLKSFLAVRVVGPDRLHQVEIGRALQEQIHWWLRSMDKEDDPAAAGQIILQALNEQFKV